MVDLLGGDGGREGKRGGRGGGGGGREDAQKKGMKEG